MHTVHVAYWFDLFTRRSDQWGQAPTAGGGGTEVVFGFGGVAFFVTGGIGFGLGGGVGPVEEEAGGVRRKA